MLYLIVDIGLVMTGSIIAIEILHWIVDIGLVMTGSIIAISSSIFPALIPKLPWGPLTVSTNIYCDPGFVHSFRHAIVYWQF